VCNDLLDAVYTFMKAAKFGKYIAGQLKKLTEHQRLAAQWCATHEYEMPPPSWTEQSEAHYEAQFLCADIFHARNTQGRKVDLRRYQ
jgi:hypothetical protein